MSEITNWILIPGRFGSPRCISFKWFGLRWGVPKRVGKIRSSKRAPVFNCQLGALEGTEASTPTATAAVASMPAMRGSSGPRPGGLGSGLRRLVDHLSFQ